MKNLELYSFAVKIDGTNEAILFKEKSDAEKEFTKQAVNRKSCQFYEFNALKNVWIALGYSGRVPYITEAQTLKDLVEKEKTK